MRGEHGAESEGERGYVAAWNWFVDNILSGEVSRVFGAWGEGSVRCRPNPLRMSVFFHVGIATI